MRLRGPLAYAVGLLILGNLCACGGGAGGSTPAPIIHLGDGTFRPAPSPTIATGDKPTALVVADFDEDGVPDLAVGNHLGDTISILLGNGDGTFAPGVVLLLPTGSGVFDMKAGRLNADGHMDLVTANSFTNVVSVFLGVGDGTFVTGTPVVVPGGTKIHGVALADFNGDGSVDLAASALTSNAVSIFLGGGNGTFIFQTSLSVPNGARQIAVGDFNEDMKADLAVASFDSSKVAIFLGNGAGSFAGAAGSPVSVGARPWNLAITDLNGDGHLDIASPGDQANAASILLGAGDGTFGAPSTFGVGLGPYGIAAGDFSGDGEPDLAIANLTDGTLSVLLGNGFGALVPASVPTLITGGQPYAIAAADINLDGILDLVVANQADDTVSVFLGNAR